MNRSNLFAGALSSITGIVTGALMYLHPEGLKAPAWVAYAAAGAFILVGLVILAIETGRTRLYSWSVVALLAAMFTPAGWVAFGPGERACTMAGGLLETEASGVVCRSVFGVGALMLAFMLFIAWRAARAEKNVD